MPDQLFCCIRKRWFTATPEEKVRQFLIRRMIDQLQYPQNHFVLEKGLYQLPHINPASHALLPQRRFDLIVLAKNLHPIHPLYPLLLIECKAVPLTAKAMRQIIGYNHFLRSCFIALANQTTILLDSSHSNLQNRNELPPYTSLLEQARSQIQLII